MEPAGATVTFVCALAILSLAPSASRAWRRGQRYAGLAALSLVGAALALLAAWVAQVAGAAHSDTGRFFIGMSAGLGVGLALGSAILLLASRRSAPPPLLPGEGAVG